MRHTQNSGRGGDSLAAAWEAAMEALAQERGVPGGGTGEVNWEWPWGGGGGGGGIRGAVPNYIWKVELAGLA